MVLQPPLVFPTTLRENIAYGRPEATAEEIARAASLAQLDDFLARLPEGLDTVVGEGGATLSSGEQLRVTIARAILRDAPLLILDEPTSALDAETEARVMAGLENLMARPDDVRDRASPVDGPARGRRSSCSTRAAIVGVGLVRRAGRSAAGTSHASTRRSSAGRASVSRARERAARAPHRRAVPDGRRRLAGDPLPARLPQLGWDVYYVEDSGASPYDPDAGSRHGRVDYAVRYVGDVMRRFGLEDRWAYLDMLGTRRTARPRAALDELYKTPTAIVNLCGATAPRAEHKQGAKLLYVETDPVYEQFNVAQRRRARRAGSSRATTCSSPTARTSAHADCPVPPAGFTWHPTRPPVVMDCWAGAAGAGARAFTTVASFANKGKDITLRGRDLRVVEARELPALPRPAARARRSRS